MGTPEDVAAEKYYTDPPCKWERIYYDSVPMPFGSGDCSMPSYDCAYEDDLGDTDECSMTCPGYEPAKEGETYV